MTILEFVDGLYPPSIAAEEKKKLKDGLTSNLLFQNFEAMSIEMVLIANENKMNF